METICKQPNNKYFLLGWDKITRVNMTEQDVIDHYIENAILQAKEDMKNCNKGLDYIIKYDNAYEKNIVTNEILKQMGLNVSKEELTKMVAIRPKTNRYNPIDFVTMGKCPSCNSDVYNGIGGKEKKCSNCGQLLDWGE